MDKQQKNEDKIDISTVPENPAKTETSKDADKGNKSDEKLEVSQVLKVTKPLMKGIEVESLQKALIAKGFHCGAAGVTGVFTKDTALAVRQFQGMNNLIVSGKVDKATVEKLSGVWKGQGNKNE